MADQEPIRLYFITGFLGSGKTTLMNNLLDELAEKGEKAGVIINEWGQENIDRRLIRDQPMEIRELNNGQLFCSCLSGKFVEALAQFARYPLKYLLVETSGMANPVSMKQILQVMQDLTGMRYDFRGMIALVDAESFLDMLGTIIAVEEQIMNSQYVLINKTDLADPDTLQQIREKISLLQPNAVVAETCYSQAGSLLSLDLRENIPDPDSQRHGKKRITRPVHYVLTAKESIEPEKAAEFARLIIDDALRIKGFIHHEAKGWFYLDGVNRTVAVKPVQATGNETKVVIISWIFEKILPRIRAAWQETCGVAFEIE